MTGKSRVGDIVWYEVDSDQQQAKIVGINSNTEATIELLTGPQKGQKLNAPWGIIRPLEVRNLSKDDLRRLTLWKYRLENKKAGKPLDQEAVAYEAGTSYDSLSGATKLVYDALSDVIKALTEDKK